MCVLMVLILNRWCLSCARLEVIWTYLGNETANSNKPCMSVVEVCHIRGRCVNVKDQESMKHLHLDNVTTNLLKSMMASNARVPNFSAHFQVAIHLQVGFIDLHPRSLV